MELEVANTRAVIRRVAETAGAREETRGETEELEEARALVVKVASLAATIPPSHHRNPLRTICHKAWTRQVACPLH